MNKDFIRRVFGFFKRETVLCIAIILAIFSMFCVKPDTEYLSYIDFRTLAILFCLMTIVAGFRAIGVFDILAGKLINKVKSLAGLTFVLVALCFIMSMIITNDVALITFVPFAIIVLKRADESCRGRWIVTCVTMQTIAANLGSMLTPIGNPQNLFLYGKAMEGRQPAIRNIWDFIKLMLPYSVVSFALLVIWIIIVKFMWKNDKFAKDSVDMGSNGVVENQITDDFRIKYSKSKQREYFIVYLAMFVISLLAVAHKIHFIVPFVLVLVYSLVRNTRVLVRVDYSLLITFTGLFIFIGNLGRIPQFSEALKTFMDGKEAITAVIASQVMSNVPAAILLEKFTSDIPALIIGTNLGGLGTLIASMASLISFKYISREDENLKGRYLLAFTLANIIFLIMLVSFYIVYHDTF